MRRWRRDLDYLRRSDRREHSPGTRVLVTGNYEELRLTSSARQPGRSSTRFPFCLCGAAVAPAEVVISACQSAPDWTPYCAAGLGVVATQTAEWDRRRLSRRFLGLGMPSRLSLEKRQRAPCQISNPWNGPAGCALLSAEAIRIAAATSSASICLPNANRPSAFTQ